MISAALHVLLVEDDPAVSDMYKLKLEMEGYKVTVAADGEDGLRVAQETRPHIIFLDVRLPKMDGMTVLEHLRSDDRTRHIPVLILSNYGEPPLIERGLRLGAQEYLLKAHTTPASVADRARTYTQKGKTANKAEGKSAGRKNAEEVAGSATAFSPPGGCTEHQVLAGANLVDRPRGRPVAAAARSVKVSVVKPSTPEPATAQDETPVSHGPAINARAPVDLEAILERLNPQQREAAEHDSGPLLIFAGAGSGKTRVLTTRIAALVARRRVFPERLLAVTFTNKAAREMRTRVAQLVGDVATDMWVGTFHHTAVRILRREAPRLGLERSFVIFDTDDTRAALKRVLDGLGLDLKKFPPTMIAHAISSAKNEMKGPDELPSRNYFDEVVRRCYGEYEAILKRSGGLDFDDLILNCVRLLRQDDAREYWSDRFRYVMVDEYQDTNLSQYTLINLIAGGHRNLAVVGDDDQSIYGWRGADVRNILDFQQDYPEAKVVHLEQNYRSHQAILDAAFHVIQHNTDRAPKRLWTDRKGGEKVVAVQAYNEVEEAEFVADEIERLRVREKRRYGDFAVLYRTNAQSRSFEDVFVRRRLPYRLVGGVKFWERREVKDLLAYLRFLFNPMDVVAFARIVNVPRRKIGEVTVERIVSHATTNALSVWDVLADPAAAGVPKAATASLRHFFEQLRALRQNVGVLRPSELVDLVIEMMDLRQFYADGTPQGDARIENLLEMRGLAEEFDPLDPAAGLETLLTEVALTSDVDNYDDREDSITLITLHMVKGLEFPVVFLVGMEEGLLPHQRTLEEGIGIDEERRLCYVGITRARDRLYLSCAFRRHLYGRAAAGMPSRFLGDIPQALLTAPRDGRVPAPPPRHEVRQRMVERQIEAAPVAPPVQRYAEGARVRHPSFGLGVIIKSTLTRTDEELVVKFDTAGLKILSGSLAPLTND